LVLFLKLKNTVMPEAKEAVMTTQEIADRLVQLCREGKWEEAQTELFSDDAESIEPPGSPGLQTVKGLDKIKKKGADFQDMVEATHGGSMSDPLVAGRYISAAIVLDATFKGQGRQTMEEIALYETKDGKIVKEEFFY
jgi:SnoaL-like protein